MLRAILSFYFDRFTDPLGLPINAFSEYIILAIIGFIAYRIAFKAIGSFYDDGIISGSSIGSILHWIIRAGVFLVIWAVTYGVIAVGKWMIANWMILLAGLGCLSIGIVLFVIGYKCAMTLKHE